MADSVTAPATYGTQADALLRKNLAFQVRLFPNLEFLKYASVS